MPLTPEEMKEAMQIANNYQQTTTTRRKYSMTDVKKSAADLTLEIAVKMAQTPLELQAMTLQGFIEEIQQQATLEGVKLGLEAAAKVADDWSLEAYGCSVEIRNILPTSVIAKGE